MGITQEIKDKYSGLACTLDGVPAKITGRLEKFAVINPLDVSRGGIEWSWEAVVRIMESGGKFKS